MSKGKENRQLEEIGQLYKIGVRALLYYKFSILTVSIPPNPSHTHS